LATHRMATLRLNRLETDILTCRGAAHLPRFFAQRLRTFRAMMMQQSPATATGAADRGDEVQRRFRYQINYSALKSLQLLAVEAHLAAIYCEHIEDLLLERDDGKFIAIQIKTQELDQQPFKSTEQIVVTALSRFCIRDARFPHWFAGFVLATNFVFYEGEGVDDLRNILACARKDPPLAVLGPRDRIRKYFQDLAARTKLPVAAVVGTLARLTLEERRTGIDQPDLEIVHALGQVGAYSTLRMDQLFLATRLLRTRIWDGCSLAVEGFVLDTHASAADFHAHLESLRLRRKRIDCAELWAVLEPCSKAETNDELLTIADFLTRETLPPGLGRMELKMAAGAIDYADVAQMKDDVASLESVFLRWKERDGLPAANQRLAHFQYLALRDARVAERFEKRSDVPYGAAMLRRLKDQLRATWAAEKATLFGCRPEHLAGASGLLSEECKIQWSVHPIGEQG